MQEFLGGTVVPPLLSMVTNGDRRKSRVENPAGQRSSVNLSFLATRFLSPFALSSACPEEIEGSKGSSVQGPKRLERERELLQRQSDVVLGEHLLSCRRAEQVFELGRLDARGERLGTGKVMQLRRHPPGESHCIPDAAQRARRSTRRGRVPSASR